MLLDLSIVFLTTICQMSTVYAVAERVSPFVVCDGLAYSYFSKKAADFIKEDYL